MNVDACKFSSLDNGQRLNLEFLHRRLLLVIERRTIFFSWHRFKRRNEDERQQVHKRSNIVKLIDNVRTKIPFLISIVIKLRILFNTVNVPNAYPTARLHN